MTDTITIERLDEIENRLRDTLVVAYGEEYSNFAEVVPIFQVAREALAACSDLSTGKLPGATEEMVEAIPEEAFRSAARWALSELQAERLADEEDGATFLRSAFCIAARGGGLRPAALSARPATPPTEDAPSTPALRTREGIAHMRATVAQAIAPGADTSARAALDWLVEYAKAYAGPVTPAEDAGTVEVRLPAIVTHSGRVFFANAYDEHWGEYHAGELTPEEWREGEKHVREAEEDACARQVFVLPIPRPAEPPITEITASVDSVEGGA